MASSKVPVAELFGAKRGDKIVVSYGSASQAVRVRGVSGGDLERSLDVVPWRWYHTVAAWPRRAWRRARSLAEDLYYRLRPGPEDDGGWPLS